MAASSRNADDDMVSGINVTPLVDVMLVLLVIFMVTAKIVVSQSLPMDLPRAAPGTQIQLLFGVELRAGGEIVVDGKRLPDDESIFPVAKGWYAEHKEPRAVIRADSQVQHGRVIRVLDLLKQAGIHKIAFGVGAAVPGPTGGATAATAEVRP